ncbi:unnamed protein product [Heterosigma akashiwo]
MERKLVKPSSTKIRMTSDEGWLEELRASEGGKGGPEGGFQLKGFGKGPKDPKIVENDALLEWLTDKGVYVQDKSDWGQAPHALAVSIDTADELDQEPSGRGMLARYDIKEGDELFCLPLEITLNKKAAQKEFGKSIIHDGLSEYFAIAILLIKERSKGADSFWKPYIDVLPSLEEVNPTVVWSEDELAALEGSPLVSATLSLRLKLQKEFETLQQDIFSKHPDLFPPEVFNLDSYRWAFVILFSRAICLNGLEGGPQVALVPYADLFNHTPSPPPSSPPSPRAGGSRRRKRRWWSTPTAATRSSSRCSSPTGRSRTWSCCCSGRPGPNPNAVDLTGGPPRERPALRGQAGLPGHQGPEAGDGVPGVQRPVPGRAAPVPAAGLPNTRAEREPGLWRLHLCGADLC